MFKTLLSYKHQIGVFLLIALLLLILPLVVINIHNKKWNNTEKTNKSECIKSAKPVNKPSINSEVDINKDYAFNINGKLIIIDRQHLYNVIYSYIQENIGQAKNNPSYIAKLTNNYLRLMDDNNPTVVLRFIALCCIESHFNNESVSCAGAYGIPQVLLRTWKGVMYDRWHISTTQYHKDLYAQLVVGFKIYDMYVKKNKGDLIKAHNGYSGGAKGYHQKLMKNYHKIIAKINLF